MFKVIISCEHGGNLIPERYEKLFEDDGDLLASHQGWDIGALKLANKLADSADYFFYSDISRLLVDLNRSLNHPKLFSSITKNLDSQEKNLILEKYFYPYRKEVQRTVEEIISQGDRVIHISVHSFTPILAGKPRNTNLGLLYDPSRVSEKRFSELWKLWINKIDPTLKVRFNYPYLGKSDGLVNYLRKYFSETVYISSELEVNQKFFLSPLYSAQLLEKLIVESFCSLLRELDKW